MPSHPEIPSASDVPASLDIEARLKAIAYQFITLYERWSEDRQAMMQQQAETAELLAQFESNLQQFGQLERGVKQRLGELLHHTMAKAGKDVAQGINEAAHQVTTREAETTLTALKTTVQAAQTTLTAQSQLLQRTDRWFWTMAFLASLIGGLLGSLIIRHFTLDYQAEINAQQDTLSAGQFVKTIWPKLPTAEKKHLLALAKTPDTPTQAQAPGRESTEEA